MALFKVVTIMLLYELPLACLDTVSLIHCPRYCTCAQNMSTIDCSQAGLSTIPVIPPSTSALLLDNNPLGTVTHDAFNNLTHIRLLSLQNCQLTSISQYAFRGLAQLKYLVLAKNKLTTLPVDLMSETKGLEMLDLSNNRLKLSSLDVIDSGLHSLKMLDIRHNILDDDTIPDYMSQLIHLRTLKISDAVMLELPAGFFQPLETISVTSLVISGTMCNVSQNALSVLTSLQTLDINDTKMTSTDAANLLDGLRNTSSLHTLTMDNVFNTAKDDSIIHKHFFQSLTSLQALSFQGNPYAFNGLLHHRLFKPLSSLLRLYLDNCGLHSIHYDAFNGLKHLKYLNLRGNFLTCFDRPSCGYIYEKQHNTLTRLEILDLSHNNIDLYDHDLSFRGSVFVNLQELYLSHNKLSRLNEDMFHSLHRLKLLDLAKNPITSIEPGSFSDLSNLIYLHLNGTEIMDALPAKLCRGCHKLQSLNLGQAGLSTIHSQAFSGLKKLQYLNLRNNYLTDESLLNVTVDSPYMWKLDLGRNKLTSVPRLVAMSTSLHHLFMDQNDLSDDSLHCLSNNTDLEVLDLSYNVINHLSETFVESHKHLSKVTMERNPFICDCADQGHTVLIQSNITIVNYGNHLCSSPISAKGQVIFSFDPSSWDCNVKAYIIPIVCVVITLLVCFISFIARRSGCERPHIEIKDCCNWDNCYFKLSSSTESRDLDDQDSCL